MYNPLIINQPKCDDSLVQFVSSGNVFDPSDSLVINTTSQKGIILLHLLQGKGINTDIARMLYGVEHLHSVMPELNQFIPFESTQIDMINPRSGHYRVISEYWLLPETIIMFADTEEREQLAKVQLRKYWAMKQTKFKKILLRHKTLLKEQTMINLVREVYQ